MKNLFFTALGIDPEDKLALRRFSHTAEIPLERLKYYNHQNIMPSGKDMALIRNATGISEAELMIHME